VRLFGNSDAVRDCLVPDRLSSEGVLQFVRKKPPRAVFFVFQRRYDAKLALLHPFCGFQRGGRKSSVKVCCRLVISSVVLIKKNVASSNVSFILKEVFSSSEMIAD